MNERRQSPRIALQTWVQDSFENTRYFCHSKDLSVGGLFLENTVPYPIGTKIWLRFDLPGRPEEPIEVTAEIVSAVFTDGKPCGMGLRFLDLQLEARSRIERYIANRIDPTETVPAEKKR